jgi:hypothetical protein
VNGNTAEKTIDITAHATRAVDREASTAIEAALAIGTTGGTMSIPPREQTLAGVVITTIFSTNVTTMAAKEGK